MNRRAFFSTFTAIAAGAALDPERLLWVPGKKRISIPVPQRLLSVEEMVDAALVRLGYFRPLKQGELADVFLEMTAMVDQWKQPWTEKVDTYVHCSSAVVEASVRSRVLDRLSNYRAQAYQLLDARLTRVY